MRDVGDEITPRFFYSLNLGDVMQDADNTSVRQWFSRNRERPASLKGRHDRSFAVMQTQSIAQSRKEIGVAHKFRNRGANSDRSPDNRTYSMICPQHFHVGRNGDN